MEKKFKWQYSWEKILLISKEHKFSFFLKNVSNFLLLCSILTILWIINFYSIKINILYYLLSFIFLFTLWYFYIKFRDTIFYITSRRIIKKVRQWIFIEHNKELKIEDIQQINSRTISFFWSILNYWTIEFQWPHNKDDNVYVVWIKRHKEIVTYLWRVKDYIDKNWHTDNIATFKTKKERHNLSSS